MSFPTQIRPQLRPLNMMASLPFFVLPALLFVAGFHGLMPTLMLRGVPPYYAYLVGLGLPLFLLFVLSLVWLKLEGRSVEWHTIKERFRLGRMDRRAWLWTLAAILAGPVAGYALMSQLTHLLIRRGIMPVPTWLPDVASPVATVNPITAISNAVGGVHGNWWPFVGMFVVIVFNIAGEEFWWRGVVLPRQEAAAGKWAWVLHGILWALFHVFKWWDLLNLLPITLALAFLCSKLRNTTPGIVLHSVANGIGLLPLALAILGVI